MLEGANEIVQVTKGMGFWRLESRGWRPEGEGEVLEVGGSTFEVGVKRERKAELRSRRREQSQGLKPNCFCQSEMSDLKVRPPEQWGGAMQWE